MRPVMGESKIEEMISMLFLKLYLISSVGYDIAIYVIGVFK